MSRTFEFHAFACDASGTPAARAEITTKVFAETVQAKAHAGRMAKRINGPVDLAFAEAAAWDSRYITTASPSEFHASGYRFERAA